jgi:multicomponent Na+:H+ antiporter subunit B
MKNHVLLRIVSLVALPFIFLFGLYVLFHGKVSPGGGFQSGAIWASGLMLHTMVFGLSETKKIISVLALKFFACVGVFIFVGFGFAAMLQGGNFLEYNVLHYDQHTAQLIGIMGIEIGVHLTVFAILSLIYWRLLRE